MRKGKTDRNAETLKAEETAGFGMRTYLNLILISGKVHRRQSRITRICIILAVALVSVIFGMADMEIRCQKMQTISENGSWNAAFKRLTPEQEALLKARPEVKTAAWYNVANYRLDQGYFLEGRPAGICGMEEAFFEMYPSILIEEGKFPADENSALFTRSVKEQLGVKVGDAVSLSLPDGRTLELTVSGFTGDHSTLTVRDAFGVFVNRETFARIAPDEAENNVDGVIYTEFVSRCNIRNALEDIRIKLELEPEQIAQNAILLGLMGQSSDSFILMLYLVALMLAVLVMVAGVLMIAGSLSSNIAQRTNFFGMLRCLGATPRQVVRFVRLEALNWCKSAVPAALLVSVCVIWILCALLRFLSPVYFGELPVLAVSLPGILAGALLGIVTVLLAAQSPAKKAAKVSPLTAVSGNAGTVPEARHAANAGMLPVETALGVHHAVGSKRSFILTTGSFAFTIILFLAFSPSIDFMNHAITTLKPYTPDLSLVSADNTCSVSGSLFKKLEEEPCVKRVFGRRFVYNVPALLDGQEGRINLISYEKYQFQWARDMLLEGSVEEAENGEGVMIRYAYAGDNLVHPGSVIMVGGQSLKVSAVLSHTPFDQAQGTENVICSEALFESLTGQQDYTIIDIQLKRSAADEDTERLRSLAGENVSFSDRRMKNQETKGAYYGYAVFLYGFLIIIAMICAFHIMNSIAMSVSSRMRQYGAMRAVGMSSGQLMKMVAAEAGTYALLGIASGCAIGLWIHRFIYERMVTYRWGDPWDVPAGEIAVIAVVAGIAVVLAVRGPVGQIREMSVVDTIGG